MAYIDPNDILRERETPRVSEEKSLVGKCLFCPLGDKDKRGVICKVTTTTTSRGSYRENSYSCALAEEGKDCVIPKVFELAYQGTKIGRAGDDLSMLHTPIA